MLSLSVVLIRKYIELGQILSEIGMKPFVICLLCGEIRSRVFKIRMYLSTYDDGDQSSVFYMAVFCKSMGAATMSLQCGVQIRFQRGDNLRLARQSNTRPKETIYTAIPC